MIIISADTYRELYEKLNSQDYTIDDAKHASEIIGELYRRYLCDFNLNSPELKTGDDLMLYCLNVSYPYIDVEFEK